MLRFPQIAWLKAGGKDSKKEMKEDILNDRALRKWAREEAIKLGSRENKGKAKKE
jgi:hypothetical protein